MLTKFRADLIWNDDGSHTFKWSLTTTKWQGLGISMECLEGVCVMGVKDARWASLQGIWLSDEEVQIMIDWFVLSKHMASYYYLGVGVGGLNIVPPPLKLRLALCST